MSQKHLCLLVLLVAATYSQFCAPKIQQTEVIPSTNEEIRWSLGDLFSAQNVVYSLSANSEFTVKQPVFAGDAATTHAQPIVNLVSVKPLYQSANGVWLNSFAALDSQPTASYVVWASDQVKNIGKTPFFNAVEPVFTAQPQSVCFDLAYINPTTVIVDCGQTLGGVFTNSFYLTSQTSGSQPLFNANPYGTNIPTKRLLRTLTLSNAELNQQTTYLFRAVPHYGINISMIGQSFIEVFSLDKNNFPQTTQSVLDAATLGVLTGIDNFLFTLVDFQVWGNGNIYILDKTNGVIIVTYTADGLFHLVQYITPQRNQQGLALGLNSLLNSNGGYSVQIGVLYTNSFDLIITSTGESSIKTYPILKTFAQVDAVNFDITQKFVVIQDTNNVYIYETSSTKVLYTVSGTGRGLSVVNPYLPSMKFIGLTQANAYGLSTGQLIFANNANAVPPKSINIIATSTVGNASLTCQVKLFYQVVASINNTIIAYSQLGFDVIPNAIIYPGETKFDLNQLASGSLLNFQETQSQSFLQALSESQSQVFNQQKLNISVSVLPFPANDQINASRIVTFDVINGTQSFLAIVQTNSTIQIWKCTTENSTSTETACVPFQILDAPILLTNEIFQTSSAGSKFTVAFLASNYQLQIWGCDLLTKCAPQFVITYPVVAGQEITGFTINDNFVYVLFGGQNSIDVYSRATQQLISQINQNVMSTQGIMTFTPKQLFSNSVVNPQEIFIDNGDSLIIAGFNTTVGVSSIISYAPSTPTKVRVSIAVDSIFLILASPTTSSILQYNYKDLTNVYLQRTVQLFGQYTIPLPLISDYATQSGYLYVRAREVSSSLNVILVVKPDAYLRDNLFAVIPTGSQSINGLLNVNGGDDQFVYFNFGDTVGTYKVLRTPYVALNPTSLATAKGYKLSVTSTLNKDSLAFNKDLNVQDTKQTITIDQRAFSDAANGALKLSRDNDQEIVLPNGGWYDGQISRFEIECKDCGKKINIKNRVDKAQRQENNITGITDFDGVPGTNNRYAQTTDSVYILDADDQLVGSIIRLDLPSKTMTCQLVTAHVDGDYIVSLCQDYGRYYAYITSCLSDCTPVGAFILPEVISTHKVVLLGNSLVVLNSDQQPQKFQSNILVYNINSETFEFELNTTVDTDYLSSLTSVFISDFFVSQVNTANLISSRLYVLDATNSIFAIDGAIGSDGFYALETAVTPLNIRTYLNSQQAKQYVAPNTIFYRIAQIGDYAMLNNTLHQQVIVTTNNVASYILYLVYKYNYPASGSSLEAYNVTQVINRYGSYPTLNLLRVSGNLVAIPYFNNDKVVVAVYDLSETSNPKLQNSSNTTIDQIYLQGAVDVIATGDEQLNLLITFVTKNNSTQLVTYGPPARTNNSLLMATNYTQVGSYNVNPNVSLVFSEGGSIQTQTIKISAINDFSTDTSTATVRGSTDESSDGLKWYWILLIVLGGVLIIGGIGFFVCKSKQDKTEALLETQ